MNIVELHNKAMDIADIADIKKNAGDIEESTAYYKEAFELEKEAALTSYNDQLGEPSTSVLLRSAASLAISCELYRDAEKLISLALSGEPPFEIAEELRDLLETVNFSRHLNLKGITLSDTEVQLVIAGKGVGLGYAKSSEVLDRINIFQDLAVRTTERKSGKKYRTAGPLPEEYRHFCNYYMSSLRTASMAFTIKFGTPGELVLSGFSGHDSIIEDITDNIALLNDNMFDKLKERIDDSAYYDNFISLTKELAPDGDDVNLFGITSLKNGKLVKTTLTNSRNQISDNIRKHSTISEPINKDDITDIDVFGNFEGILKVANASNKSVEIVPDQGKPIKLIVPDGLSDIVKRYWDEYVRVEYIKESPRKIRLIDIEGV